MKRVLQTAVLALVALTWTMFSASAQAPLPRTFIVSPAQGSYFNQNLGIVEVLSAQAVIAVVQEFASLTVDADQTIQLRPDTGDKFVFFVENRGNIPLNPVIGLTQVAGDDFDLGAIEIVSDLNNNGAIDPGEPLIPIGGTVNLAAGQRRSYIVAYRTPAGVADATRGQIRFSASSPAQGLTASATGTAVIATSGMTLSKRAGLSSVDPSGELIYTLGLRNNGTSVVAPSTTFDGEALLVDGNPASAILVRDAIPLNLNFTRFVNAVDFTPLYHVAGAARHSYQTTAPGDLATVDAVAFMLALDYAAGRSTDLSFAASATANSAGATITNTGQTWQIGSGGALVPVNSNTLETPVNGTNGRLRFMDAAFANQQKTLGLDTNTFIQIDAAACNVSAAADTVAITIRTTPGNDVETVVATETGTNTGVFRTPAIPVQDQRPAIANNGILSGHKATTATARGECAGRTLVGALIINPGGFVFDAYANTPLAGRDVVLRRANGTVVARTRTDAEGFYQFANVAVGNYRIAVENLTSYRFPSKRKVFPGLERNTDPAASFGLAFGVTPAQALFGIDIPLDRDVSLALTLSKKGSRSRARIGEFISYELTITNKVDFTVLRAVVNDVLPGGFAFLKGSARLDGKPLADPVGAPGPKLVFDIDRVGRKGVVKLSYVARILLSAGEGDRTNLAVASGLVAGAGQRVSSNASRWTVRVGEDGGVFSREGVILGKVFLDCDGNGEQSGAGEIGIPGVKLHMENGRSVVTDLAGQYSLPVVQPRTHVLSVDRHTLPEGTRVQGVRVRDALMPGTRFVDIRMGEIRTENFPVGACDAGVGDDIVKRVAAYKPLEQGESLLRTDLPLTSAGVRPISGQGEGEQATRTELRRSAEHRSWILTTLADKHRLKVVEVTRNLESELPSLAPGLGFLDLADGDNLMRNTVSIRVKGPAAAILGLEVNGRAIGSGKIGQRSVYAAGGVQAVEYVSVRLDRGANRIRLILKDPFGNERGAREITVHAPGAAARIEVRAPEVSVADPHTPIPVVVRVVDAEGRPTGTPMEVTLLAERGHWDARDIRDAKPGVQVFIDHGEAVLDYIPPALAGTHVIEVDSELGRARARISLVADTSEQVVVGIIEGAVRFSEAGGEISPLIERDQITSFQTTTEGVRGALYLKGRIRGDALLTLRYESDKDTEERLFRDIRPDEYYPVYGDSSERGFDAQSGEQLYVKVERGLSYVLYGDLNIAPQSRAVRLGAYRRKMTGAHGHVEEGPVTVDVFVARTEQDQIVKEIRGRGLSGPYDLALDHAVDNSETVEIVTRDRDQPDVVIETRRLTRFTDYTLDFFANTILFDDPIPAFDDDLNPVYIRITYEARGATQKYWVYGGEARLQVTEGVAVGYREVRSVAGRLVDERRTVRSAFGEADLGAWGKAEVELAQTENRVGTKGWGARVSLEKVTEKTRIKIEAAETDEAFDAPNSSVRPGRREVRAKVRHKLARRLTATGDALYTSDTRKTDSAETRYGAEGRLSLQLTEEVTASAGARWVTRERAGASEDVTSGIAGLGWRPSWLQGAEFHVEAEQDLARSRHHRFEVGGTYQYDPETRLFAKTEIASSASGLFGLGDALEDRVITRAGIEHVWTDKVKSTSEYRSRGAGFDDGGAIANALDGKWDLTEQAHIRARVEHIEPVSVDSDEVRNTAVALGFSYESEPKTFIFENDVEWGRRDLYDSWYASTAVGKRKGDVTFLLENRFALREEAGGDRVRDRLRFGAAWRPGDASRWAGLAWYGIEVDQSDTTRLDTLTHYWSLGGEYQLTPGFSIRARHAGRHHDFASDDITASSLLVLESVGFEVDLSDRLSVALDGLVFEDLDAGTTHTGFNAEVGVVVVENVMLSLGYGYDDLKEENIRDIYRSGFYLRLKAKLDSDTWNIFEE